MTDTNDLKFQPGGNVFTGDMFFSYLKDAFDFLYAEGINSPKMMSVGLHPRMMGRPGRAAGLARFLDYIQRFSHAWVCRRLDIAEPWVTEPPANGQTVL